MSDVDFPYLQVIGFMLIVGLVIVLAVSVFTNDGSGRPTPTPARVDSPTGIATGLYLVGMLALVIGGLIFAFAETSIHEILATLIGLMGAIFFAAGAVVTELQRIKKQLQADAARLATNNPQS